MSMPQLQVSAQARDVSCCNYGGEPLIYDRIRKQFVPVEGGGGCCLSSCFISHQEKEMNRATWSAFEKGLKTTHGDKIAKMALGSMQCTGEKEKGKPLRSYTYLATVNYAERVKQRWKDIEKEIRDIRVYLDSHEPQSASQPAKVSNSDKEVESVKNKNEKTKDATVYIRKGGGKEPFTKAMLIAKLQSTKVNQELTLKEIDQIFEALQRDFDDKSITELSDRDLDKRLALHINFHGRKVMTPKVMKRGLHIQHPAIQRIRATEDCSPSAYASVADLVLTRPSTPIQFTSPKKVIAASLSAAASK